VLVDEFEAHELGGHGRDPALGHAQASPEFPRSQVAVFAQGDQGAQGRWRQVEPFALQGDAGLAAGEEILHRFLQAFGLAGEEFRVRGRRRVSHNDETYVSEAVAVNASDVGKSTDQLGFYSGDGVG